DDLHETPLESVPALADWTLTRLAVLLAGAEESAAADSLETENVAEDADAAHPAVRHAGLPAKRGGNALALAVLAGDFATLRDALQLAVRPLGRNSAKRRAVLLRAAGDIYGAVVDAD